MGVCSFTMLRRMSDPGHFGGVKNERLPLHHNVIEDGSEHTADDLGSEGTFWRELSLLRKLQIAQEVLALLQGVECQDQEIHVC